MPPRSTSGSPKWVLVARHAAAVSGGVFDEARVNVVRYLEGTPEASTLWIDTGWAILLTVEEGKLENGGDAAST